MSVLPYNAERREYLEHEVCRRGFLVLARDGATLPPLCARCGASTRLPPERKRFAWHDPSWYIALAAIPLIYPLIRLAVVRRGDVLVSYCPRHYEQEPLHALARWGLVAAGSLMILLALIVLVLQIGLPVYWALFTVGYALLAAAVFYPALAGRIRPYRIEKNVLELQGFPPAFLNALPDISPPVARQVHQPGEPAEGRSAP